MDGTMHVTTRTAVRTYPRRTRLHRPGRRHSPVPARWIFKELDVKGLRIGVAIIGASIAGLCVSLLIAWS